MKRRGMVSIGLVLLEVALLANLGRWLAGQDPEVRLVLGLHLMGLVVVFVAVYLIRTKADPAQLWPEDLDDVWPNDEEAPKERPCSNTEYCHRPHPWTEAGDPGDDTWHCPGVFMLKPCPELSVHAPHLIPDPEFPDEPWQCPGVASFEPEEIVAPTVTLEPVATADPAHRKLQGHLEPVHVPCGSKRFHKAHEWMATDEAGTEPEWCPGVKAKRKAPSGG